MKNSSVVVGVRCGKQGSADANVCQSQEVSDTFSLSPLTLSGVTFCCTDALNVHNDMCLHWINL